MKSTLEKIKDWLATPHDSPMGTFRLKEVFIVGVIALILALWFDKGLFIGWAAQTLVQFAKAALVSFAFYWLIQRRIPHRRTHELPEQEQFKRTNTLLICYALLIACALII